MTFPLSTLIPLLAFAPLLVVFFLNLWAREPYQFFPLSIAAACYLAYRELKQRTEVGGEKSEVGGPTSGSSTDSPTHLPTEAPALLTSDLRPLTSVLCLAPSILLLGVATVFWSPWLAAIAAFLGLVGLTLRRGGWGLFVAMIPALLMLAIIIPPPLNLDTRLTLALRSLAVRWSSPMLDLLGVTHVITGNLIEIPGRQLLVAEACSGINSVLSTLAACLFYLLLRRRSVLESIFALACTGIFVLLGNVARFTLGAWLLFRWRIDILSGWWHAGFGLVLFISYIVLILSFDQLWLFLTLSTRGKRRSLTEVGGRRSEVRGKEPAARVRPSSDLRPLISDLWPSLRPLTSAVLALLCLAQLAQGYIHFRNSRIEAALPQSGLREGATFSMPDQIGDWQRLSTSPAPTLQKVETMGVFSQIWHYKNGPLIVSVALDYPFRGYHDVTVCYSGQGWQFLGIKPHAGEGPQNRGSTVEVAMQKGFLKSGTLFFSTIDEFGNWPDGSSVKRSFRERFRIGTAEPTTYRIQALVTGYTPLPGQDRDRVTAFFGQARELLVNQLFNQLHPR